MDLAVAATVSPGGSSAARICPPVAAAPSHLSHDPESPAEASDLAALRGAVMQAPASHQGAGETLRSASVASHRGADGTVTPGRHAVQSGKAGVMQGLAAKFANLFARND